MNDKPSPAFDTTGYETVIGLETHVQLKTRSKLFCSCMVRFGNEPNSLTCNICTGMPGTLPALNAEAMRSAILVALGFNCTIAPFTKFDRKNYFYPDLPKGYQISQFDKPFSYGGHLEFELNGVLRRVGITRIHLEEDAGKSIHVANADHSHVDLNRAGTALVEMVTEPDIRSPEEAYAYLTLLKQTVQYLGVSDCDMDKGSLRVDGNISVRPVGETKLGTKVEIKNVNSFRYLQNALELEQKRQIELHRAGRAAEIRGETKLYDDHKHELRVMRTKEAVQDYRYFPEPDIVPVTIDAEMIASVRENLPELPRARHQRFVEQYSLSESDAALLTGDRVLADFFEAALKTFDNPKQVANWVQGELLRYMNETKKELFQVKITPVTFAELVKISFDKEITNTAAKEVFQRMAEEGGKAREIIQAQGLAKIGDSSSLEPLCQKVIDENPGVVEQYKGGKESTIGFFVGQIMRATKGKADPALTQDIFKKLLGA